MDSTTYYNYLNNLNFSPSNYEKIAAHLMKNGVKEMYHALINEADICKVLTIPNLEVFWCCRCHLVADDGSTGHEHWHGLVQFEKGHTLAAYKLRLKRAKVRLHPKNTFKKVLCPDHAVGVLRYICCKDGQRQTKRGPDGLMGSPHTHYERSVYHPGLLHKRGKHCVSTREGIYASITKHLSAEWMTENNISQDMKELHCHATCTCDRGKRGIENRKAANKKRSDFYKTDAGKNVKENYRKKNAQKRKLIDDITELSTLSKKAKLCRESILTLMKML